jgi:hypothetical protein
MFGVRRSTAARLLAVLVVGIAALVFAGGGTSSATDPTAGLCQEGSQPTTAGAPDPAQGDSTTPPADPAPCSQGPATEDAPADPPTPPAETQPDPVAETPDVTTTGGEPAPQPTSEQPSPGASDQPKAEKQQDAPAAAHSNDASSPSRPEPAAGQAPAGADAPATSHVPADAARPARTRHASRTVRPIRRAHRKHHVTESGPIFPSVFVDWAALTPLAPPEFGAGEATRFPGPLFLLPIFQAAATQYNVPWQILASINEIETDFGANTSRSSAGAMGWMQFMPSTWKTYGVDANGDGIANPEDPVDAIFSAARYLHASGSVKDLGSAVFSYNHAGWYVARVLQRAVEIGSIPEDLLTSLTEAGRKDAGALRRATGSTGYLDDHADPDTIGRVMLLSDEKLADATLADPRVQIYSCGRDDIRAGVIDRRVLQAIEYLAFRGLEPSVTSLRCGHGLRTASGNISEHSYGDAVDVARINGIPILGHQGVGSITDTSVQELLKLGGAMRPHQIISLMTFTGASNTLALADHDDHIHIGFAPVRPIEAP